MTMHKLDVRMYDLEMKSARRVVRKSEIILRQSADETVGNLRLAGFIRDSAGVSRSPMRILGAWALVVILHGGGEYVQVGRPPRMVGAGDIIIVHPRTPHAYGPINDGKSDGMWDEFYIVFDGPVFDAWSATLLAVGPVVSVGMDKVRGSWLKQMTDACRAKSRLNQVCAVQSILARLASVRSPVVHPTDNSGTPFTPWIEQARRLLSQKNVLAVSPMKVARDLELDYDYFRKAFTKQVGMTPARFAEAARIDRACELLGDPDVPLRLVASRCGFCDEFHFSRRFKKHVGIPPSAYRLKV